MPLPPCIPMSVVNAWNVANGRYVRLAPKTRSRVMPLPDGRPTAMESNGAGGTGQSSSPYVIPSSVVVRARDTVAGLSRRARRRVLAIEAQAAYLAVLDPASGATTRDRLAAADGAARVAGLSKEATATNVALVVTFRGMRRDTIDAGAIEARIAGAAGLPPLAGDGATGAKPPGGGEGG